MLVLSCRGKVGNWWSRSPLLLERVKVVLWRKSHLSYGNHFKHKQVVCMGRKMPFTVFKYLFSFQRYSSFLNMQISQVMTSYTQPNFDQIWWQKLYQKFLILCSKILLKVLHNTSLTVLVPWQQTGFQTPTISKAFLATFSVPFPHLQMVPCMHDPAGV